MGRYWISMCSWWNKEYPVYEVWGNVLGVEVVLVEEDRRDITSEYAHFTFSHTIWPLSLSSNFCTDIMTLAETASYKVRRWYWWVCCKRTGERGYSDISPLAATKTNAKYYYITNLQHLNSKFLFWRGTRKHIWPKKATLNLCQAQLWCFFTIKYAAAYYLGTLYL